MRLDNLQLGAAMGHPRRGAAVAAAALLACFAALAGPGSAIAQEEDAAPGTRSAEAEPDSQAAHVNGSLTARLGAREGEGNDRLSTRLSVEWGAGEWSGGFTAQLENTFQDDAVKKVEGVGSLAFPERWVAWKHDMARSAIAVRLGTVYGVRFGEGLVLGAASFDGLNLVLDLGSRTRVIALAGVSDTIDHDDFYEEPFTLFPDQDEDLGRKGDLAGLRVETNPWDPVTIGINAIAARGEDTPTAQLASVDVAGSRGIVDFSAEMAVNDGGGSAFYGRADIEPIDKLSLGVEHRRYRHFVSPLGNQPRYEGFSSSDDHDETGWLLRADFSPTRWFTGSWSFDTSEGGDKADGPTLRRDHRLALQFAVSERTAVSYGFELEDVGHGYDGRVHSVLVSHAFEHGGRLSARLSLDDATESSTRTLRLGYRVPLHDRRFTLLFDDTLRQDEETTANELSIGGSIRVTDSAFLTVRGTVADLEPNGLDLTWYQRF
jgi:hypothetical protein